MSKFGQRVAAAVGGRATAEDRLHLTLAFIGDASRPQIDSLIGIGARTALRTAPFDLTLDRVGEFRRSAVVWLGTPTTPAELERLVLDLREDIEAAGLRYDRKPFRAHVTLVRSAKRAVPVVATSVSWHIRGLTLIASRLTDTGPVYTELGAWPIGAADRGRA